MTGDEQAIDDILKKIEAAWNAGDSKAYADSFAEDVSFIHIYGGQLDGRGGVEAAHRQIFDTVYKGSRLRISVRSVRFVRPDVAIVFSHARLTFYEGNETRDLETRPTLILVKQQGAWQVVTFQNTRISEMPREAAANRLAT